MYRIILPRLYLTWLYPICLFCVLFLLNFSLQCLHFDFQGTVEEVCHFVNPTQKCHLIFQMSMLCLKCPSIRKIWKSKCKHCSEKFVRNKSERWINRTSEHKHYNLRRLKIEVSRTQAVKTVTTSGFREPNVYFSDTLNRSCQEGWSLSHRS